MRKAAVFLGVIALVLLAQAAYAVDLQAGWYANFGTVYLEKYDPNTGGFFSTPWSPASALGQYGSIEVSEWEHYPSTREVTVLSDASVSAGVLFEDAGTIEDQSRSYSFAHGSWGTNYDASGMRLQLLRRPVGRPDELVWQQTESGQQADGTVWNVLILPGDQLVFRVVAVPEPTSVVTLACGMSMLLWKLRRHSR